MEHRDTEKSAGMFATLVITLPSACLGGELIVRHDRKEVCIDLNNDDTDELSFAAFYADCVHEVRPVTSGFRLALIYNLVHESKGPRPAYVKPKEDLTELTQLLKAWATEEPNGDAVAADMVHSVAAAIDCEVHLALLVSEWRSLEGSELALSDLPFTEAELCPQDAFNHLSPDEQYFHEATGNEGATIERTYRRAALVIWPKKCRLNVIHSGGFTASLAYLKDLAMRWKLDGSQENAPLWKQAHELSGLIFTSWYALLPTGPFGMGTQHIESKASELLTALIQLSNSERIEEVFQAIIKVNAHDLLMPCAQLLAQWAASTQFRFETGHLMPSATLLIATLLGERAGLKPVEPPNLWARPKTLRARLDRRSLKRCYRAQSQ